MIILTGASGFVGKNALISYDKLNHAQRQLPQIKCFASRQKTIELNLHSLRHNAYSLASLQEESDAKCAGILHAAFLNRTKIKDLGITGYINTCRKISHQVYEYACAQPRIPLLLISSGSAQKSKHNLQTNPYPCLKAEEERLFASLSSDRPVIIFRLYGSVGYYDDYPSRFALGQFIQQGYHRRSISINSNRLTYRSYVYLPDLFDLSWDLFLNPPSPGLYLIDACIQTLEIMEVAQIVSSCYETIPIKRRLIPSSQADIYSGNPNAFSNLFAARLNKSPTPIEAAIRSVVSLEYS